jgi:prepilin-type N-terminal cleavage/methylation domain-containing protein
MSESPPLTTHRFARGGRAAGLTLIELLLVIAVMGVLAGLAMPSSDPSICDQLRGVASIAAADLAYARGLAVANGSTYRIRLDVPNNRYILEHSGVNPALNPLPPSPFRSAGDPSNQYIVALKDLPHVGPTVRVAAATSGTSFQQVDNVEFGSLGQTTRSSPTTIWFAAGPASAPRYISLSVNPVTGLTTVGPYTSVGPPSASAMQ